MNFALEAIFNFSGGYNFDLWCCSFETPALLQPPRKAPPGMSYSVSTSEMNCMGLPLSMALCVLGLVYDNMWSGKTHLGILGDKSRILASSGLFYQELEIRLASVAQLSV